MNEPKASEKVVLERRVVWLAHGFIFAFCVLLPALYVNLVLQLAPKFPRYDAGQTAMAIALIVGGGMLSMGAIFICAWCIRDFWRWMRSK